MSMISVKGLQKSFGKHEVLKGIDIEIQPGEVVAIVGPSGCGKSTFLRCLNLLEKPTGGQILYHDVDLVSADARSANKVLLGMGMVFQQFNLFPHLTVLDNIMLAPALVKKRDKKECESQAMELLKTVGLEDKRDAYPNQLSGGQQQRVALARHPERPGTADFIKHLFTDFFEQRGDRLCAENGSILGGVALFHGKPVTVIGHRKGRSLEENLSLHFGMPSPEGYRKAQRLMLQAEKFRRPVITFIDTPGAYPGLEAEARGQAEAIARTLALSSRLTVPVVSVVTGEGGSGGALALGVGNRVLMLENAVYSVLSPEGFAASSLRFSSAAGVVGGTGITEGFTTPGVAGVAVAAGGVAASVVFWSVLDA